MKPLTKPAPNRDRLKLAALLRELRAVRKYSEWQTQRIQELEQSK